MRTTLEQFFSGKFLKIPAYQRDYAWETDNIDELWDDIDEALRIGVPHYIGTFILAKKPGHTELDVVDGQQRLTTVTMLVRALVERLPEGPERIVLTDQFLARQDRSRLALLGTNEAFFRAIIEGQAVEPATQGQRRLRDGLRHIRERVAVMPSPATAVPTWLAGIGRLQVLEFVEENEGNAIRIFETVNDRGRPLSVLEKIKSHLIFASNKYMAGRLDVTLAERFGTLFRLYDSMKELGGKAGLDVELISQKKFTEDSILRYHFFALPSAYHDWSFTAQNVLDDFLKAEIRHIVSSHAPEGVATALESFIDHYTSDLVSFFAALLRLLERAQTQPRYYKLFTGLGLSATLYPLLVRLETHDLLERVPTGLTQTMLDLVELTDLRVYKTGGKSPERDIYQCARDAGSSTLEHTAMRLRHFVTYWMGDDAFRARLGGAMYSQREATRYILLEHDAAVRASSDSPSLTVEDLRSMRTASITIEHALAQERTFSLDGRGFADEAEYEEQIHRLGNLALLEQSLNSAASKKTPEQKASSPHLYNASAYVSTRRFGAEIQGRPAGLTAFGRADIDARTSMLVDFCAARWSL